MGNDAVKNIQMPGLKVTGDILGSRGATADSMKNVPQGGSYMARGRMSGGASGNSDGKVPDIGSAPVQPVGSGSIGGLGGMPSGGGASSGTLNKLPKLEL